MLDQQWPVIALTPQTPQWYPDEHTTSGQQYTQQQQALQQALQVPEDPRRRLTGLQADISRLQQEYDLGLTRQAAGSTGAQQQQQQQGVQLPGALSTSGDSSSISGLQLLLGLPPDMADCRAVVALQDGPEMEVLSEALASLLGPLHCRKPFWPSEVFSTPDTFMQQAHQAVWEAAAAAAAAAADPQAGNGTEAGAAFEKGVGAGEENDTSYSSAPGTDPFQEYLPVQPPAALVAQFEEEEPALNACKALQYLASPGIMTGWSLLSVHFLRTYLQPYHTGVMDCLEGATIWPMAGLGRFSDYLYQIVEFWDMTNMAQQPRSTGWPALDASYKVVPGEVTIVTGVPNSGKSEWLDALAVNLAEQQGWRFAMCSMEKKPRDHARQLLEKIGRKPMLTADYSRGVPQMTEQELVEAYAWLCQHFYVIAASEGDMPSIKWVLDKARAAKIQFGIDGLVIDPYNELNPARLDGLKEHEHVNQTMAMIRKFARDYKVAVWLVAHPRQMNQWTGQRPGLQDISGGANFANKADNGLVVHRDWARLKELKERKAVAAGKDPSKGGKQAPRKDKDSKAAADGQAKEGTVVDGDDLVEFEVQIWVEKVRNKSTGSRGDCTLIYDRATGRYLDPQDDQVDIHAWYDSLVDRRSTLQAGPAHSTSTHQQQDRGQQGVAVGQAQGGQQETSSYSAATGPSDRVYESYADEEGKEDEEERGWELERQLEEQERASASVAAQYDLREGRSERISGLYD